MLHITSTWAFHTERNITHWRSVDIDGNIIDEQKFQ